MTFVGIKFIVSAMKSFIFLGMKHSGKSTHGKLFASSINTPFFDLDELIESLHEIEKGEALSCREIFTNYGVQVFRNLESRALKLFFADFGKKQFVLAMGGGIADAPRELLDTYLHLAISVYIKLPAEVLIKRILWRGLPPFLNPDHPEKDFQILYDRRSAVMEQYAFTIIDLEDSTVEETQKKIAEQLKEHL